MPRPSLNRSQFTARLPTTLMSTIRTDAIAKGYTMNHRGCVGVDWQGYLGAIFSLILSGKIDVPKKD